jgi:hypothetical protein
MRPCYRFVRQRSGFALVGEINQGRAETVSSHFQKRPETLGHQLEVEAVDGLALGQIGVSQVAGDAPILLVFQRGELALDLGNPPSPVGIQAIGSGERLEDRQRGFELAAPVLALEFPQSP